MQDDLLKFLKKTAKKKLLRFMTPGHKGGLGLPKAFKNILTTKTAKFDLSLFNEEWHWRDEKGLVYLAEKQFADLYQVKRTFFSVQGTTGAIQAMFLSSIKEGEKVLLPRNLHRSIISAMILTGAVPLYYLPTYSKEYKMWLAPTRENLKTMFKFNDFKALCLVNPNYYGIACDLKGIVTDAHKNKIKVLVDEAHGAHLKFSDKLPLSATEAGADLVAQSTHKLLGALTQASVLHCGLESLVKEEMVEKALYMLQTTSPSYLLVASLKAVAEDMHGSGKKKLLETLKSVKKMRRQINQTEGLSCLEIKDLSKENSVSSLDFTKVVISVKKLFITGYEAMDYLWHYENVQVELADEENILLVVTLADQEKQLKKLLFALKKMVDYFFIKKRKERFFKKQLSFNAEEFGEIMPILALTPREAFFAKKVKVPFNQAKGKIAAEMLSFYPPGIPMISYGERISQEIIEYCLWLKSIGALASGINDSSLQDIWVVA